MVKSAQGIFNETHREKLQNQLQERRKFLKIEF